MRSLPKEFADIWANKKSQDIIIDKLIKSEENEEIVVESIPINENKKKYKIVKANKIYDEEKKE